MKKSRIKFKEKIKLKKMLIALFYIIIGICILYNVVFSINTAISSKEYFNLFGISLLNMDNEFMSKDIRKNDLVIIKETEKNKLQEGDIIAYQVHGQIRINKIFSITNEGYKTKYNQTYYLDVEEINYNQIIGKAIANIPILGTIMQIIQSKIVSIIVIIILALLYSYNSYKSDKKIERKRKKLLIKNKKGRKNVFGKTGRI